MSEAAVVSIRERGVSEEKKPSTSWTQRFMRSETGANGKRLDIEGMRAIAVLLVLLFHAGVDVPGGFVGVDVFFVISGYIITGSLAQELRTQHSISVAGFYARRAKRLLPATAVVLVATAALTVLFVPETRWRSIGWDTVLSALYMQNWRLAASSVDYDAQGAAASPLQHFWSLAVEEQFYLLWPFVLLLVTYLPRHRRRRRGRPPQPPLADRSYSAWLLGGTLAVLVPSLVYSIYLTSRSPNEAYFVTPTRLWELALGGGVAIAAHWLARTPLPLAALAAWVGLAVAVASAFVISGTGAFPGYQALAPTLGTAAVLAFGVAAGGSGPAMLLGIRPMVWIGGMSYSLYLWHWPLLVVAEAEYGDLSQREGLAVVAVSAVVAYFSLTLVENPLRFATRFRSALSPSPALALGVACTLIGVFAGLGMVATMWPPAQSSRIVAVDVDLDTGGAAPGQPKVGALVLARNPQGDQRGRPVDKVQTIIPDPLQAYADNGLTCSASEEVTTPDGCQLGDSSSSTTVVLVGDSHAGHLATPMGTIARERGWNLIAYTKQGCSFAPDVTSFQFNGGPYPECTEYNDRLRELLRKEPPDMFVYTDVDGPYGEVSRAEVLGALVRQWRSLVQQGTKVVVIADTPTPRFDVPACVSKNRERLTECAFPRSEAVAEDTAKQEAAAAVTGVEYVDISYAICPTEQCAVVIGGVLVYKDINHLTATYAQTLAPRIDALLPRPN